MVLSVLICAKSSGYVTPLKVGYFNDIKIWIHELQYGELSPCPECGENVTNIGNYALINIATDWSLVLKQITTFWATVTFVIHANAGFVFGMSNPFQDSPLKFQAFPTRRLALDKKVFLLGCCLRKDGVRMHIFSTILLKLHSIQYGKY